MTERGFVNAIGMRFLIAAAGVALAVALTFHVSSAAAAPPSFKVFKATPSTSQAGGHPDIELKVEFEARTNNCAPECYEPRIISTHFPNGFIGNPHVAPKCTLTEYNQATCPVDSQIGYVEAAPYGFFFPLYNMETSPDQAGLLGSTVPILGLPVFLELTGRTDSDYGLDSVSTPLVRSVLTGLTVRLWGVPADPVHDVQRFLTPLEGIGACYFPAEGCPPNTEYESQTHAEPTVPAAPFLQNPTECGVARNSIAEIEYYGGYTIRAEAPFPAMTGCKQLSFSPSITVKPTTSQADTASGVDVALKVPQTQSPYTPSPSELRTTKVTFPPGFTINPNAADGKVACDDANTAIGTLGPASCPEFSKVGTLILDNAALPGPIPGAIYLGESKVDDRYRLILAADGFATHVKIVGSTRLDPQTGQVTVAFENLPQSPLQEINTHFFGSERGLLATPTHCGKYSIAGEFVPWDQELETRQTISYMTIDSGPNGTPCPSKPRPFAPKLRAGTENSTAGFFAPFSFSIEREDGEQNLTGLSVRTPPGVTAVLKGIPYCSEAAIAQLRAGGYTGWSELSAPSCGAASQVGTAVAGAGAGTHPLYVPGQVYLAGPYKGAPLSFVVVVPAVSGPYDLGNVVVRAAIEVDRENAQVNVVSDPIPQIFEGIPFRTRFIRVDLDRSNFTLNPTNCDPFAAQSTVLGDEGGSLATSTHFQVSNCDELPFSPKLSLKLTGGLQRRGHPAIHATFDTSIGDANSREVVVTLPKGELLDNAHIGTVCTRPAFARNACPPGSLIGQAEVATPLLDQPLKGSVYLRSSSRTLPDIAIHLMGQIDFDVIGHVDSVNARLRTVFDGLPDVPAGRFSITFAGGNKGLLQNSESLCGVRRRATVQLVGHNNARKTVNPKLQYTCGKKSRPKRKSSRQIRKVNR